MIRSFKELAKDQGPSAGGKGRTLARLYQAGYRVPDGFIILPAAFAGDELTAEAWAQVQAHLARLRRCEICFREEHSCCFTGAHLEGTPGQERDQRRLLSLE